MNSVLTTDELKEIAEGIKLKNFVIRDNGDVSFPLVGGFTLFDPINNDADCMKVWFALVELCKEKEIDIAIWHGVLEIRSSVNKLIFRNGEHTKSTIARAYLAVLRG